MAYECWCLSPRKLVRLGKNKKYVAQSRNRTFLQLVMEINSKALSISLIQSALELVTVIWCRCIFLSPYSKIGGLVQWLAVQYQPPPTNKTTAHKISLSCLSYLESRGCIEPSGTGKYPMSFHIFDTNLKSLWPSCQKLRLHEGLWLCSIVLSLMASAIWLNIDRYTCNRYWLFVLFLQGRPKQRCVPYLTDSNRQAW